MNRPPNAPAKEQTPEKIAVRRERRRHRRHPAQQEVMVYWQGRFGVACESPAILRNVSAGGFGVELDEKFEVGSVVVVKVDERSLQCMVRHVQEQSDSYLAGLEVLCSSDGSSNAQSLAELSAALSDPRVE